MSIASLRTRLKRLDVPGSGDECRCREIHVGERVSVAEALDPDTQWQTVLNYRCVLCGRQVPVRLVVTEVIVESREDVERLRAAGVVSCPSGAG
jgi:hypothetical protein